MNGKGERPQGAEVAQLLLEGNLTVETVGENKKRLETFLSETKGDLSLRIGPVERVDVSLVQLLCSLHRSLHKVGRKWEWSGEGLDAILALAEKAGVMRSKGCSLDPSGPCLWKRG